LEVPTGTRAQKWFDPLVPGLQQQHAIEAVLTQPARDHRTGRAGADDDVIIGGIVGHVS
jgi:hypothetical protein